MKKINLVKNIAIIVDFVISGIATSIQNSNQALSGLLFGASAIILFVAVVCVVLELILKNKK